MLEYRLGSSQKLSLAELGSATCGFEAVLLSLPAKPAASGRTRLWHFCELFVTFSATKNKKSGNFFPTFYFLGALKTILYFIPLAIKIISLSIFVTCTVSSSASSCAVSTSALIIALLLSFGFRSLLVNS